MSLAASDELLEPSGTLNATQDVDMDDNQSDLSSAREGREPKAEEDEGMNADEGLFGDDEDVEYVKHDQYVFYSILPQ